MTQRGKISFFGAAQGVTGSNHIFEVGGLRMMVDCGLFQGAHVGADENREQFPYKPSEIDVLFVTHAHIDHIGRIPKLVREGFSGIIYSTVPTLELAEVMLMDTVRILGHEAKENDLEPIYVETDVTRAMELWKGIAYHESVPLAPQISALLLDAGHILGSAMVVFTVGEKKLLFSGDLGNSPAPLLRDTEEIKNVAYVVMESTYGDRNHKGREERKESLRKIIVDAVLRGGTLVVPAFSLERTQELLFELNEFVENKEVPPLTVFVDSPLAIKATEVYKHHEDFFNKETMDIIQSGDDIFRFPRLRFTETKDESMQIWDTHGPKMVMAGSGMANGGRIVHHLKHYIGDPSNTILFVGYQAVGTTGRQILEGAKSVRLFGTDVNVHAQVKTLQGYSAHKDSEHLLDFIASDADSIQKVFLVHGELKSSLFLAQRMKDYIGIEAVVPGPGETVELEF